MRLLSSFLLTCALLNAADLSGTWMFQVDTSAGSGSPTFQFKQEGDKLTGHYSGTLGESEVAGSVSGDDVAWSFPFNFQGQDGTAKYKGKIVGETKMKGTVDLSGIADGTWTADKK